jgi:hypothetical protein
MFGLFNEVAAEIFGSFRITRMEPGQAVAILDGDTLGVAPDGVLGADNIEVGPGHVLAIHADGYEDWTEELTISPNATLERSYSLDKEKGAMWWMLRGGAVLGAGAAIYWLGQSSDGPPPVDEPLPGPPAPPGEGSP